MLVVRTANAADIDGVLALAASTGVGMTTLKADRAMLAERLRVAERSFREEIAMAQRDYVFVLEDTENDRIAGICAIKGAVGLDEPFYNYRIGTIVHAAPSIGIYSRQDLLYVSHDMTGSAELCSLYLHPSYRNGNNGKLLSKSRFMFIAQFPHLFQQRLFAEMRGFQLADGTSPFWESIGRKFFNMDFDRADDLCQPGSKGYIAELMPRYPIYTAFLPASAREAVGKTHVDTLPARRLLEQEGLYASQYIDIFDGGPVLHASAHELRALRESVTGTLNDASDGVFQAGLSLVCNTIMSDFRVVASAISLAKGGVRLLCADRCALTCAKGDTIRLLPLVERNGAASLPRRAPQRELVHAG